MRMIRTGSFPEEYRMWVAMLAVKEKDEDPNDLSRRRGRSSEVAQARYNLMSDPKTSPCRELILLKFLNIFCLYGYVSAPVSSVPVVL